MRSNSTHPSIVILTVATPSPVTAPPGLTAERMVNMDTKVHPELINRRFAYVSVSRASHDVQVFTNDQTLLAAALGKEVAKTSVRGPRA